MSVPGLDMDVLLQQLSQLQNKNKELQAAVSAKDQELRNAQMSPDSGLGYQDSQGSKIVDLSKRNRALQLALEKEKSKVARLQSSQGNSGAMDPGVSRDNRSGSIAYHCQNHFSLLAPDYCCDLLLTRCVCMPGATCPHALPK